MTKEVLKMALEALERCVATCFDPYAHEQVMSWPEHFVNQTITAIKEALAQQQQEPVAGEQFYPDIGKPQIEFDPVKIVAYNCTCGRTMNFESDHGVVAPQRTWVGLTDDDRILIKHDANYNQFMTAGEYADVVQQLTEARLKDKNHV